jgi:hypothetical protein
MIYTPRKAAGIFLGNLLKERRKQDVLTVPNHFKRMKKSK